jgi:hypothetical protein
MTGTTPYAVSFQTRYSLGNGTTYPIALNPLGGNVGIATTAPWRTFSVDGTVGLSSTLSTGTGGNYLCIDTTTWQVLRGNGSACTASSARFKENVQDLSYGIDDVMNLRAVSYNYKAETNMGPGTKLGFIAEEMYQVIPEVVTLDDNGNVFGLDYALLTSVLTKAAQELNSKVIDIDIRLSLLEATVGSSTPSTGGIAFSEVLSSLEALGARFVDGIAYLKNVFVENLTIGTPAKPSGITLYDEVTGEPYCLKMRNGAMVSVAGDCANASVATSTPVTTPTATTTDTVAPEISLMGNNPAQIFVGSSYIDLGATVTDMGINLLNPSGPLVLNTNLGLQYTVNGVSVTDISIDTSTTTTHTVVFSAVDMAGNWAYATRTVDVVLPI